MIINHEHPAYVRKREQLGAGQWNGAYYYSKEICDNIIPNVKTDRNWMTVNVKGEGEDHAIVFIHNNNSPENYEWLKKFKDLVIVCGVPSTVEKVKHLGKAIYLPLSIDTEYVEQFKTDKKTKKVAYFGRKAKAQGIPQGTDIISGLPREELLKRMAKYEKVYAVGRCALEALCLGVEEILPYDERYPDVKLWKVIDNKEAAKMLQKELDKIDKPKEPKEEKPKAEKPKAKKQAKKKAKSNG